jgi:hypothetical protein
MAYTIQKNVNTTDGYGWTAIYAYKELLKSNGWKVIMSSDGYSVDGYVSTPVYDGYNHDIITSPTYDGYNKFNANCWFVLQMPSIDGTQRQFMFQMGPYTDSLRGKYWTIRYSYSSGFFGGTASVAPTAADQQLIVNGAGEQWFEKSQVFYMAVGANADGYNTYFVGIDSVTKIVRTFFAVDRCVAGTYPSVDTDPFNIWCNRDVVGIYADNIGSTGIGTLMANAWFAKGQSNETFARNQAFVYKNALGTALHAFYQVGFGTNGINGKTDMLPIITGRAHTSLPVPKGTKGTSSMLNWYCTTSKTGDTYRHLSDRDKIVFDDVLLPWDGSVPVV